MPKTVIDVAGTSCKRKHNTLTIYKKVELLKKFERGTPAKMLCEEYGIGKTTFYDIQKHKKDIFQFFLDSDSPKEMEKRRTIRSAKNEDLEKVLMEWFRQRKSENVPVTGPMLMQQAKNFHKEMNLSSDCEYSHGWLSRFKSRHGIRHFGVCGEHASTDEDEAERFVEDFSELISKEKLSAEQIYNASLTSLFWKYVPRKTLAAEKVQGPTGFKFLKERLTVLACANAAGSYKCKLLVIGRSANPKPFKGIKVFPAIYKSNKKAWISQEIFTDWFKNHFVPEARARCKTVGFPDDAKILLLLDSCTDHSLVDLLSEENIIISNLPSNCTSILQPMDLGILRSIKCCYKSDFLNKMLASIDDDNSVLKYVKQLNIKDAVWGVAQAWESVPSDTLINSWNNIWPTTSLVEISHRDAGSDETRAKDTEIFSLLEWIRGTYQYNFDLDYEDIREMLDIEIDGPITNIKVDEKIQNMFVNPEETDSENDEDGENESDEDTKQVPINQLLSSLDTVIEGLEHRTIATVKEIMTLYNIRAKLEKEISKSAKHK